MTRTPTEQAGDLLLEISQILVDTHDMRSDIVMSSVAKKLALVTVKEVMKQSRKMTHLTGDEDYWLLVKERIEKT